MFRVLILYVAASLVLGSRVNMKARSSQKIAAQRNDGQFHIGPWKNAYGGFGTTDEERTWFLDQPSYQQFYPEYCNGQSFTGKQVPFSMDGWSCIHKPVGGMGMMGMGMMGMPGMGMMLGDAKKEKKSARVSSVASLNRWNGQRYICCAGSCRKSGTDCGKEPLSFEQATKQVLQSVDSMQTASGNEFEVYTLGCAEGDEDCDEPEEEEGVLATVDYRLNPNALQFQENTAQLTEASQEFLYEFAEPLSLHASMLLTVLQEVRVQKNESLRVLFCAHGTLTETGETQDLENHDLPRQRAELLTDHLRKLAAKVGTNDAPVVGNSHGHLQHDPMSDSPSQWSISLIMKVYEPRFFKPECKTEDLYAFVPGFEPKEFEEDAALNSEDKGEDDDGVQKPAVVTDAN